MTPAAKKTATKEASGKKAEQAGQAPKIAIAGKALGTRGRTFIGTVISDRMAKTVTVEWERRRYVPKYQRYERRRTRLKAHNEIGAKIGDKVEIKETRPISKTKTFIVTKIIEA